MTDKASGAITATEYYLSDGDIIAEERSSGNVTETIWYAYSGSGSLAGFIYDGEDYYYRKNLEGDITGIYDDAGNLKVTYTYDMWGKQTGVTDTTGTGLADINPFRYRGYYYDSETGYYYLNSRYEKSQGYFIYCICDSHCNWSISIWEGLQLETVKCHTFIYSIVNCMYSIQFS